MSKHFNPLEQTVRLSDSPIEMVFRMYSTISIFNRGPRPWTTWSQFISHLCHVTWTNAWQWTLLRTNLSSKPSQMFSTSWNPCRRAINQSNLLLGWLILVKQSASIRTLQQKPQTWQRERQSALTDVSPSSLRSSYSCSGLLALIVFRFINWLERRWAKCRQQLLRLNKSSRHLANAALRLIGSRRLHATTRDLKSKPTWTHYRTRCLCSRLPCTCRSLTIVLRRLCNG